MEKIDKLSMERKNGWLQLDDYFIKRIGREYKSLEELYENGIIESIPYGINEKFWILDERGNKVAMFKIQEIPEYAYSELYTEEISKMLGIKTAHYDLATYLGRYGVISYNFSKDSDEIYKGFDIIADFYENKLMDIEQLSELYGIDYYEDTIEDACEKLNNLEDIWAILEDKYKNHENKQEIVSNVIDSLVDKLILDVFTVNNDDHCEQWGIVNDEYLMPNHDYERILNIREEYSVNLNKKHVEDKQLLFTVDSTCKTKPLEVLEHFLDISSSEYKDRVRDKANILKENIDIIPSLIEKRTEHEMPLHLKNYFTNTMHEHMDRVCEIVDGKGKGTK